VEIEQDQWVRDREPDAERDNAVEPKLQASSTHREAAECSAEAADAEAEAGADEAGETCSTRPA
jgi:hypothetical protein